MVVATRDGCVVMAAAMAVVTAVAMVVAMDVVVLAALTEAADVAVSLSKAYDGANLTFIFAWSWYG